MIAKMKKLSLLASLSEKDELLRELMLLGCVQINEPQKITDDEAVRGNLHAERSDTFELNEKKSAIDNALKLINKYSPQKVLLFDTLPEVSEEELLREDRLESCLATAREVIDMDDKLRSLKTAQSKLHAEHNTLLRWNELDVDLDCAGTKTTHSFIGTIPTAVSLEDVNNALTEKCAAAAIQVTEDKYQRYVFVISHIADEETANEILREYGFALSPLTEKKGSVGSNLAEVEKGLDGIRDEEEKTKKRIEELSESRADLKLISDMLATKILRAEASEKTLATGETFALTGWIPEENENEVTKLLNSHFAAFEFEEPTKEEAPEVPVKLKNNKLTAPLMMVTEMYSLPSYDGVDPNPLILPWFTIFFGIMFADIGYGLIFLIAGLLGSLKIKKPKGTIKNVLGLLKLCGITTIIFGFVFGSFFGDSLSVFSDLIGIEHIELWSLTNPLQDPMTLLIASLAIGVLQILVGMAINAYMLIRDGKPLDALFDVGSWWLLFAGIALGALGKGWYLCFAGVAALILTQGRSKPTLIGKLIGGLASLYDITSYFGDILSYIRLMALMLAGSVIASVVNILGGLKGSVVMFIIVFIIGHAFNIAVNVIGTFVHAARLQYLEFFGKFYRDGGKPFRPLSVKTKYYDITK